MITVNSALYTIIYRLALLACLVVISWLAFGTPPSGVVAVTVGDKVLHAAAFMALGYLLDGALPSQSFWKIKLPLLLAYGMFIEAVQWQLSYREFSLLDFLADGVGILLYWACHKPIWMLSNVFLAKADVS